MPEIMTAKTGFGGIVGMIFCILGALIRGRDGSYYLIIGTLWLILARLWML